MDIPDSHPELDAADNQFILGLYRYAVDFYQPKIEDRTGVRLGNILVRNFNQYNEDRLNELRAYPFPWYVRLFRRGKIRRWLRRWQEYYESTLSDRESLVMACYWQDKIYVSFATGTRSHEHGLAFCTVHELAHALWERIAGERIQATQRKAGESQEKLRMFAEGFAAYAETTWFRDLYPSRLRKSASQVHSTPGTVYYRGRIRVAKLVKEHGDEILFDIPKRWREL